MPPCLPRRLDVAFDSTKQITGECAKRFEHGMAWHGVACHVVTWRAQGRSTRPGGSFFLVLCCCLPWLYSVAALP